MNSDHFTEQSEPEHFTEDSSNIIPSSEADPPPPLTCHIPPCRSGDLCVSAGNTLNGGNPTPGSIFNSYAEDGETQSNERQRTFTQADDFQDMSKTRESVESANLSPVENSEVSSEFSAYRLGVGQVRDTTKRATPTLMTREEILSSYPSLSNLPLMSQNDRIDLVWDGATQFASSQTRGSTPVRLGLMPDSKESSNVPTFISPNESATPRWAKSLDPRSLNDGSSFEAHFHGSSDQLHSQSTELSGFDSATLPSAEAPHLGERSSSSVNHDSGSALQTLSSAEKSISSSSADRGGAAPSASAGEVLHNPSDESPGFYQLSGQAISVHLSIISTPSRSRCAQGEAMFLDGFNFEFDETDPKMDFNRLVVASTRLWSRMNEFFQANLYSDATKLSTSQSHTSTKTESPEKSWTAMAVSSESTVTTVLTNTKPFLISSARTSSSSSDLFIPRTQRQRGKRPLGQVFSARTHDARYSSSSSEHPPLRLLPPVARIITSDSHPTKAAVSLPVTQPSTTSVTTENFISRGAETQVPREVLPNNDQRVMEDQMKAMDLHSPAASGALFGDQTNSYQPSLTLVLETPSEGTDEQNSPSVSHKTVPDSASASVSTGAYGTSSDETHVMEVSSSTFVQSDHLTSDKIALCDTLPKEGKVAVYGRWHPGPYYYAGTMELPQKGFRLLVHFDDGSSARLRPADIIPVNVLPVQTEVYADWSNSGEFWAGCVVEAHLMDSHRPYLVFCRSNGERKALTRKEVSIHQSEVNALRESGKLPLRLESFNNGSPTTPKSESAPGQPSLSLPPSKPDVFSPEISLDNVLFSKRQMKAKRYRSSWITPFTRLASTVETPDTPHSAEPLSVYAHESPRDTRVRSESFRSRKGNVPFHSKRSHDVSSHSCSDTKNIRKKQRLNESQNTRNLLSSNLEEDVKPMSLSATRSSILSPDTRGIQTLPPDSSTSVFLRRSLCRSLGIPIPGPCVFSNWTLVFTGHSMTTPNSDCVDRGALEQLVLACGGTIVQELSPMMLREVKQSPGSLSDDHLLSDSDTPTNPYHQHIAVVAPNFCRTLKYFQALATLGRVPILNTTWIVDACREDAACTVNQNSKPIDWPMHLLLNKPGYYELPRGILSNEQNPVSWLSVPLRYRSPAYRSLPSPSLFELRADWLDGQSRCQLIAIVTDDTDIFGPAWSNILQLASGAVLSADEVSSASAPPIPIYSISEAPQALAKRLPKHHSTQRTDSKGSLVLLDISELPADKMSQLDSLPCQLVTCDYFIQSLICGYLLNPSDSSSFVPPCH